MTKNDEELHCLGVITGAQGIKGEVKLKSFTQEPLGIGDYGVLYDKDRVRSFKINSLRMAKKAVVAKFAGINDRNAAEALRGVELFIPHAALPDVPDDEYYHADLVGLDVFSPEGEPLGSIKAVCNFGAGDILEIALSGAQKTEMLLFNQHTVPEIDIAARRVVIVLPQEEDASELDGQD